MKRQIVQIAVIPASAGEKSALVALTNDGALHMFAAGDWHRVPPIPQDPEPPEVTELRKFVEGNGDDRP
jgi:hypothetical protein